MLIFKHSQCIKFQSSMGTQIFMFTDVINLYKNVIYSNEFMSKCIRLPVKAI